MLGAWTQRARMKLDHQSARVSAGMDDEGLAAAPAAAPAADSGSFGKKSPRTPRGEAEAPQKSAACAIL